MKSLLLSLLLAHQVYAAPAFVQVASGGATTPTGTSIATSAGINLTSGNSLIVLWSSQQACTAMTGDQSFSGITNSGTTPITFQPVYPSTGDGMIIGIRVTNGGTGYTTDPTCAITGGGGSGATCNAFRTGNVVTSIQMGAVGSGYTSAPTVSLTLGGGSGATATVTAIGENVTNTSCASLMYAHNIPANTSDVFTVTHGSSNYRGVIAYEVSGLANQAPVAVVSGDTSATSITSPNFTTTDADTFVAVGSRVEALTQTWTAGSSSACAVGGGSCTLSPGSGGVNGTFMAGEYKILASTVSANNVSISSGGNANRIIYVGVFKAAAAGGARRRISVSD